MILKKKRVFIPAMDQVNSTDSEKNDVMIGVISAQDLELNL